MARIRSYGFLRHLSAQPNQHILHYRKGKLVRQGGGHAYWFNPLSAAVAQVPIENCETTFVLKERTADFQEVNVQCTLTYRLVDPQRAAARVNFAISIETGAWIEQPLERLAGLWAKRAQQPARSYLAGVTLHEALVRGADQIRGAIEETIRADEEMKEMGLHLVAAQITQVAPTAELEKALQTPTREAIQQKADEAVFVRRAVAVEKERAIKENELATEIELAGRQEQLIQRQAQNKLLEMKSEADAQRAKTEGEAERSRIMAEAVARDDKIRADAQAAATRVLSEAELEGETRRVAMWAEAPAKVSLGLALQSFAGKVQSIQHLNLTPEILGDALRQFLRDQADK